MFTSTRTKLALRGAAAALAVTGALAVGAGQAGAEPGTCTSTKDVKSLTGHSPHGTHGTYGWYLTWANCDGSGTDWVKIDVLLGTDSPCYSIGAGKARTVDYHPNAVFSHSASVKRC